MRLRLQQALPTPNGLVMGVVITGPRNAWIRFATLELPFESLPPAWVNEYLRWTQDDADLADEDEPLPLDWR